MKKFPSIPNKPKKEFKGYAFDKLDGSNLRISWSKGEGWVDFATRTHSIPTDHKIFKEGYDYFLKYWKETLEKSIKENNWKKVDFFFEFFGDKSLAGRHVEGDPKRMVLIDVCVNNKAKLMDPQSFLDTFKDLKIPKFLGILEYNEDLIEKVKHSILEGMTFEGIVLKDMKGNRLKLKSDRWKNKIRKEYPNEAEDIINS